MGYQPNIMQTWLQTHVRNSSSLIDMILTGVMSHQSKKNRCSLLRFYHFMFVKSCGQDATPEAEIAEAASTDEPFLKLTSPDTQYMQRFPLSI